MNKVILCGRLTGDVEIRYTQSGKAYARVAIAVDRPFSKDKTADFINLVAWEKTAEFMSNYLSKGVRILVDGRLQISKYKDKDDNDRTSTEVLIENVEFADGKRDSGNNSRNNSRNDSRRAPDDDPFAGEPVDDEDTPF